MGRWHHLRHQEWEHRLSIILGCRDILQVQAVISLLTYLFKRTSMLVSLILNSKSRSMDLRHQKLIALPMFWRTLSPSMPPCTWQAISLSWQSEYTNVLNRFFSTFRYLTKITTFSISFLVKPLFLINLEALLVQYKSFKKLSKWLLWVRGKSNHFRMPTICVDNSTFNKIVQRKQWDWLKREYFKLKKGWVFWSLFRFMGKRRLILKKLLDL